MIIVSLQKLANLFEFKLLQIQHKNTHTNTRGVEERSKKSLHTREQSPRARSNFKPKKEKG